jgi:hypothetical protein
VNFRFSSSAVLFALLGSVGCTEAPDYETFDLAPNAQVYGCNTKENATRLIQHAGSEGYFDAAAQVGAYIANACPTAGPFRDNRIHGVAVIDERGGLSEGYDRIAIVRWQFQGGERQYFTPLVRSNYGIWHNAIDIMIASRTVNGIVDFFFD